MWSVALALLSLLAHVFLKQRYLSAALCIRWICHLSCFQANQVALHNGERWRSLECTWWLERCDRWLLLLLRKPWRIPPLLLLLLLRSHGHRICVREGHG